MTPGATALPLPLPLPRFLQIEPVGQCNLRCRMCPISWRQDGPPWGPPAFIEPATFRRLVDGFPDLEELQLQGLGEPLMHPQFFDMVSYAAQRGIRVSTNSNLTLLTEARARLCVSSGLDALHVSIDGATAATYEFIRQRANFAKVLRNLDRLLACRSEMGRATPAIRIVSVAMRRNLDELPGIVALAQEHIVDTVFVQHLCHDYSEASLPAAYALMRDFVLAETLLGVAPERVERAFAAARARALELGVDLRLPRFDTEPRQRSPRGCDWPSHGAYLSYRGEAVWRGPDYQAFRDALAAGEPPAVCRGCGVYLGTF